MAKHRDEFAVLAAEHSDLVEELYLKIAGYAAKKDTIWSSYAGVDILEPWGRSDEWTQAAGDRTAGSRMFGLALWNHLTDNGWSGKRTKDGSREIVVYNRLSKEQGTG